MKPPRIPTPRPMLRFVACLAGAAGAMGIGSLAGAQMPLPHPSTTELASASLVAASSAVRAAAEMAAGHRLVVSVEERRLWWLDGPDTLFSAPVAVGKGSTLRHGTKVWDFSSPVSIRRVLGKSADPRRT